MLAKHTPAPLKGMIRNELLNELQAKHQYEIVIWPMHYPDELCMNLLRVNPDPNVIVYIALMKGITPIITVAGHKAFIADLSQRKPSKLQRLVKDDINKSAEKYLKDKRDAS